LKQIKIVSHIHSSDFSYDGNFRLEKIVEIFRKKGVSAIFITEHSETMNQKKMDQLVAKCKNLSNKNILVLPGVEFLTKEGYHILGIGIEKFSNKKSIKELVDFIKKNDGLCILAHPKKYKKIEIEKIKDVDGIEICNFEYDGFLPRVSNIEIFKEVKRINDKIIPFCGLDFHRSIHNQKILINMKVGNLNKNEIFRGIKNQEFVFKSNCFSFRPQLKLNIFNKTLFLISSFFFDVGKSIGLSIFKFLRKINLK